MIDSTKLQNSSKRGTVRTNEIVEGLNASDMTVRRDLAELEEKGVPTLRYMVELVVILHFNIKKCLTKKTHTHTEEKRYIAKKQ